MRKKSPAIFALFFAAGALFSLQSWPASAHSELVSSDPEAFSVLAEMPTSVLLTFSGELLILDGAEYANQLIVTDSEGASLLKGEPTITANTISTALAASEVQGEVTVTYRVVSADGHPIEGSYTFSVGDSVAIAPNPQAKEVDSTASSDWTPFFLVIVAGCTAIALVLIYRRKKSNN